jgi:hypothetical protein
MILLAEITPAPRNGGPPPEFAAFMVSWVLLGLGSFLFFHFNRNAALKRRVWPVFGIATGLIFASVVYFSVGRQQPKVLLLMVPALILISFLNLRTTRFCDACGRTLYRQPLFSRTQFCPHCGAELK